MRFGIVYGGLDQSHVYTVLILKVGFNTAFIDFVPVL
jgi:hypothetical protein